MTATTTTLADPVTTSSVHRLRIAVVQELPAVLLVLGLGLSMFSDTVADADLWGHVRFGADMLRSGSIPVMDPYSYRSGDQPWINHEWLTEVIFAALYEASGVNGLIALKLGVGLALLLGGYGHLRANGVGPIASIILLALASAPLRLGLATVRPHLFTYLGFFVTLLLIDRAARGRLVWLWGIPPILAVWVNLHGGVLAGFGILGLAAIGEAAASAPEHRLRRRLTLGAIVAAGGLALMVNPYGITLPAFLLRTATVPRPEIMEWLPLKIGSVYGLIYVALLAVTAWGLVGSGRIARPSAVLILGVTALLPLVAQRHFPLFALSVVVLGAEPIAIALKRFPDIEPTREGERPRWIPIATVVLAVLLCVTALPRLGRIRLDPRHLDLPARAVSVLRQSGVEANLALPFNWGEYALWHLGPRIKVSIDGRRETVYSDPIYHRQINFQLGARNWDAILEDGTDLVLVPEGSPTANLMELRPDWNAIYNDSVAVLFAPADSPLIAPIRSVPSPPLPDDGGGLVFPVAPPASGTNFAPKSGTPAREAGMTTGVVDRARSGEGDGARSNQPGPSMDTGPRAIESATLRPTGDGRSALR